MFRKVALVLLLIAFVAADETTRRSEGEEVQLEKRSLFANVDAYNAFGNKLKNLGFLTNYGHLLPAETGSVKPVSAYPIPTSVEDPVSAQVEGPFTDSVPVGPQIFQKQSLLVVSQSVPLLVEHRVYVPKSIPSASIDKNEPVFVKVPYAVPIGKPRPVPVSKPYSVVLKKHEPAVAVKKLAPYLVPQSLPINRLVSYAVPQPLTVAQLFPYRVNEPSLPKSNSYPLYYRSSLKRRAISM